MAIGAAGIDISYSASASGGVPGPPSIPSVPQITATLSTPGSGSAGKMPLTMQQGAAIRQGMFTKFPTGLSVKVSPFAGGGLSDPSDNLPPQVYGYSQTMPYAPSAFPLVPVLLVGAVALAGVGYLVMRKR